MRQRACRRSRLPNMTRVNMHGNTSSWPRSLLVALRTRSWMVPAGAYLHAATCHVPGPAMGNISPWKPARSGYTYMKDTSAEHIPW